MIFNERASITVWSSNDGVDDARIYLVNMLIYL